MGFLSGLFGGKKQTIGYRYYMGLHFAISYGPVDALKEIRVGKRVAWTGEADASGTISIYAPTLFGGEEKEGGVSGTAGVMMGTATQTPNIYLQSMIGGAIPAFRGVLSLVLNKGYVGTQPYIKPWAFLVRRIKAGWKNDEETSTPITEYGPLQVRPWKQDGGRDPRACENEHLYRFYSPSGTYTPGPWRTTLTEAQADGVAKHGRSYGSLIGWQVLMSGGGAHVYPHDAAATSINPGDPGQSTCNLLMHYTDQSPSSFRVYADNSSGNLCLGLPDLTLGGGDMWFNGYDLDGGFRTTGGVWRKISSVASNPAGWSTYQSCDGGTTKIIHIDDIHIEVQRIPRGPDDPCSPACDDPYPPDPGDPVNFCLIDSISTARGPYVAITQSYKMLRVYVASVGIGYSQRPIGPLLLLGDPNYNNVTFWTDAYNAAVTAGEAPAGWTYGIQYPQSSTALYSRVVPDAAASHDPWYPETIQIGDDMNPAHIIYQCIIDTIWGMGYPSASIDDTVFREAALALYNEEFGLSLKWNQQGPVQDFIQIVCDHIGGVWYSDPFTGKFGLKLIRDDYDPDDLEEYKVDDKTIALDSWQRAGYGDTTNQITVVYTDRATYEDTPITVQDLANIQAQGAAVSDTIKYPGITKAELAGRVAMRDCIAKSTGLAGGRLTVNRNGWSKIPGDVIKLTYPKLGLSGVIVRILLVGYGSLEDGKITLQVAEDLFGLPNSTYIEQEPAGWVEPDVTAKNIITEDLIEAPYWDVAQALSPADLGALTDDAAYIGSVGARINGLQTGYNIHARVGAGAYDVAGSGAFTPTATLVDAIDQQATSITVEASVDLALVEVGDRVLIGSGREAEWCAITAISGDLTQIDVSRAVLDTTPQEWPAGTRVWFPDTDAGTDENERATGDDLHYKLTGIATGGEIDISLAIEMAIVPDQRFTRPYPPGNIAVNGQAWPTDIDESSDGDLTITWAHRDRTQQTATLVPQADGDIGPEVGTTYNGYVYDDDTDELMDSETGISGTSWEPELEDSFRARVEIEAERDGIVSWQRQVRIFDFASDTARITEISDPRIGEGRVYRELE